MSSESSIDPQLDLIAILDRLQIAKYFAVAGNQLWIYDYIITFPDEVKYVWTRPRSFGTILFFLTRYPVMVEVALTYWNQVGVSVSVPTCTHLFNITGWMFIYEVVIAEIILTVRVWALYGRSRKIAVLFIVVATICIVVTGVVFVKFHTTQQFLSLNGGVRPLPGCYVVGGSNIIVIGYIMLLAYEVFILCMTLFKGFWRSRRTRSPLVKGMLNDGIVYFLTQAAISLVNVVIFLTQPHEYANLLTPLQRSFHSLLSARIVIRLRKEAERANQVANSFELRPIGTLAFVHRAYDTYHDSSNFNY